MDVSGIIESLYLVGHNSDVLDVDEEAARCREVKYFPMQRTLTFIA